ncbi:MAG TPA: hypothetical protein EYN54_06495 [Methylococcaceae bacterium]|nr:hypothetical protein [Methylococcaceae bacterium]
MKQELIEQCKQTIDKALHEALTSYSSPLVSAVKDALFDESEKLKQISQAAVSDLLNSEEFALIMKEEMKRKLARVLITQFGGELEKSVNKLKSDPTTRAKITLAIDSVVNNLTDQNKPVVQKLIDVNIPTEKVIDFDEDVPF